jgi:hypothetical protein
VKSPDILIVQINRYLNLTGSKIQTTLWPNDNINLPSGDEYTLCAIGHHLGDNFNGGHYIASVKCKNEWVRCNDTQISKSSESDSKSMECNICIYTKVFSSNTPFAPTDEWQDLKGRSAPGGLHYSFGLKGNYARNMDLGESVRFKNIVIPNKSPSLNTDQQKGRKEEEVLNIDSIVKDDGWTTPKKRGFSRKNCQDQDIKPDKTTKFEPFSDGSIEEECKSCGKKFKLLFSHLSRAKNCQKHYDMESLRENIKSKRRECDKVQKARERELKRNIDEEGFKKGRAEKLAKERETKKAIDEKGF